MVKLSKIIALSTVLAIFSGCSNPNFKSVGSSILSSTGIVSGSQADAAFSAGEKLAKAADSLSDEQEYYLGRSVAALVFTKYRALHNAQANTYINKVGRVVAAVSDKPETFSGYHFIILDSNEINALSAPGGFVFITKGLIKIMPDEDALAGVLAHEVAHVVKGHGTSAISNSNLTSALLIIGKEAAASQTGAIGSELTNIFGDSVNDVFETVLTTGYSRSQEYDSDEYAAELIKRAGYNPNGLHSALKALEQSAAAENAGGWASTHPKPSKRLSNLDDEEDVDNSVITQESVRAKRFKIALAGL